MQSHISCCDCSLVGVYIFLIKHHCYRFISTIVYHASAYLCKKRRTLQTHSLNSDYRKYRPDKLMKLYITWTTHTGYKHAIRLWMFDNTGPCTMIIRFLCLDTTLRNIADIEYGSTSNLKTVISVKLVLAWKQVIYITRLFVQR